MGSPPLTIRNITSFTFELKLVERFEAAQTSTQDALGFASITQTLNGLISGLNVTSKSSPQLAANAEGFNREDVAIKIAPFGSRTTDIQPNTNVATRLTFEVEGQRYWVDKPSVSGRSTVFSPLSPDPKHEFTGVYLSDFSYLAIYSSTKPESWMSKLRNDLPLSALSIPGTHNSPTHYRALPSVRCQAVGLQDQLRNGVRFLDIRVQPESPADSSKDGLILVHSAFPISLTGAKYFRGIVNIIFEFLDANPTESIVMSLKREGVGKATDQQLSRIIHDHYANDSTRWFTENRIPTLGEARKKIVLLRRFGLDESLRELNDGAGFAIDGESWPDNCADGTCLSGEIRVQDFYEVAESDNIEKKITYSTDLLKKAATNVFSLTGNMRSADLQPFFINFLSASNFWRANCWPDRIAQKVNPKIIDYLCRYHNQTSRQGEKEFGDGGTGIVVCDWVGTNGDWDLVRCIVGMNAKLELKR